MHGRVSDSDEEFGRKLKFMTQCDVIGIYYKIVSFTVIYINVLRDHWCLIIYFISLTLITQLIISCIICVAIIISMDFIEYIYFVIHIILVTIPIYIQYFCSYIIMYNMFSIM